MARLKCLLLMALVMCYAMHVVMGESYDEKRREKGMSPQEEEKRAKEEELRRREKTAKEEQQHKGWDEEMPPAPRRWWEDEDEGESEWRPPKPEPYGPPGGRGKDVFVIRESKKVISTEAGEMRVVKGFGGRIVERPLHIGFITMEPRTLFVPQYLDSSLVLFIRRGEAKLGYIYDDEFSERRLKMGDIYRIPPGSTFYIVNTGETQRLNIICSIDPAEGLGFGTFQSFFIGGGANPVSVMAGFDPETLSTAFNVSKGELKDLMTRQSSGPIMYADATHSPSLWANFLELKDEERLKRLKMVAPTVVSDDREKPTKSWWSIFDSVLGTENKKGEEKGDTRTGSSPDSFNLYDEDHSFSNGYGWSIALDKHGYEPLKNSGIGVYLVNLTAGSMMAPHVNPMATEYGVVLAGAGTIQVVFPNGTSATNTKVNEGDVFWIPRYFPFCQIASRAGPFEFFGFTTSSHRNRPQFLVGASSVLAAMRGPEFATAFGITEDKYNEIVNAQREAVILPSPAAALPDGRFDHDKGEKKRDIEKVPKFVRSLGSEMIMGFE